MSALDELRELLLGLAPEELEPPTLHRQAPVPDAVAVPPRDAAAGDAARAAAGAEQYALLLRYLNGEEGPFVEVEP